MRDKKMRNKFILDGKTALFLKDLYNYSSLWLINGYKGTF